MTRTLSRTRPAAARVGRLLRALLALVALLGLTVGIPVVLTLTTGSPLPDHGVNLTDLGTALNRQLDDATLMHGIAVTAWIAWLIMLVDITAEIRHAIADARPGAPPPVRSAPRSPLRLIAAVLVGAIAGAVLTDLVRGAVLSPTRAPDPGNTAARTLAVAAAPARAAGSARPPLQLISHDTATPARTGSTGHRHTDRPIPAWAADAPGGVHHVVKGDNLWDIAGERLDDPTRWREIFVLNRHKPQANGYALTDPAEIHVGWVLALPALTDAEQPPVTPPGPGAGTPPSTAPGPQQPGPGTPPPATTAPSGPATTRPAQTPPTAAPAAPARPTTPPQTAPAPVPAPTGSPVSAPPTHGDTETSASNGVHLPSQAWVSFGLAAAIASTATTVRLIRRRHARLTHTIDTSFQPTPNPTPEPIAAADDAGLVLIERTIDPYAPHAAATIPATLAVPAPVAITHTGDDVSLFDLPGNGVALTGDGALAAARAIVAAALTTDPHHTPALYAPVVVTTAGILTELLPHGAPLGLQPGRPVFDNDRLVLLPDTAAAIAHLETEMIRRRRELDTALDDAGQPYISIAALNADDADINDTVPPYVLVIPADERYDARLRAATADRHALHLHPVAIGATDALPTYAVDNDGTVASDAASLMRFATMTATDLAATLALVTATIAGPEEGTDFEVEPPPTTPTPEAGPAAPAPALGAHPPVHLHVLGPVAVGTDEGTITTGIRSGSYVLLAYLAVHPVGRTLAEIADALYPDRAPTNAANQVRTDINSLRKVLRDATGRDDKGGFIVLEHDRYRIDSDAISVDLWQMLTALTTANNATTDADALTALRTAVDLYGGDYATGIDRAWVVDQATTHRHQYLNALTRIAEIVETDAPDQAVAALEQAINADPINEELYQRLMRIHGRHDRTDAVHRAYHLLENRLADLGMAEPSSATQRVLQRQIPQRRAG
jgi:DNA-binding SARP family transcriptional activator